MQLMLYKMGGNIMKKGTKGTIIVPRSDADMIRIKHWLIARKITYLIKYFPTTMSNGEYMIMANMSLVDRILYKLTFNSNTEKIVAFG